MSEAFTLAEINDLRLQHLQGKLIDDETMRRVVASAREDRKTAKPSQRGKKVAVGGVSLFDLTMGGSDDSSE